MRGRNKICRWLIAIWLLIGCETAAYAYTQAAPPSAWRTTPTLSADIQPAYQFRSTSAYAPTMNIAVYTPGSSSPIGEPRRVRMDMDDEEGDEMGVINTPIGEPWVLLLLAVVYIFYRKSKKSARKFAHVKKL
ncbi:MAG: hypothetical protein IJQ32_00700 [Paludibacteraceae bacterium]|nr:hypothetical protein [Paludibacteraceae bacterium]